MDYLFATPYEIEQDPSGYHFSSDTELLGRFLVLSDDDRVLDVGTNNGALLCYAALHEPELLAGIDLFPEVIELAEKNLSRNGIQAELSVSSLQAYRHDPFTAVICNPPYFESLPEELKNRNPYLYAARHRDYLSVLELFENSRRLLELGGRVMIVYPAELSKDVFTTAGETGFLLSRFCPVYDTQEGTLKRFLMEFTLETEVPLKLLRPVYLDCLHSEYVRTDLYVPKSAE